MARPITASAGPTSSDPREIFDRHIGIIAPIKKDADDKHDSYRKAHASYRSALKLAKRDGVDLDALTDVLKIQKEDPADVDRRFRNTNNYLIWLGVPIGTQLGIDFKSGDTVASVVDREAINGRAANESGASLDDAPINSTPAMIARAYGEGHAAGSGNKGLGECPYTARANATLKTEWEKGWSDAQADIAQSLAPPTKVKRGAAAERKTTSRKTGTSTKKKKAHEIPGLALQ